MSGEDFPDLMQIRREFKLGSGSPVRRDGAESLGKPEVIDCNA